MTVITRFAPSPTGFLHIGGARTALFNWLFARHHGGRYLLRIEDTDRKRATTEAVAAIHDGLAWLGLEGDEAAVYQHTRLERHAGVARELLTAGRAYPCYCTPEELAEMRAAARAEGRSFLYDRRWRDRDATDAPAGVAPAIRIKAPLDGETVIADLVQGRVTVANDTLDDMIILRSDGTPTYNFSVVVDDHDMGITHVIRGDDHLNNAFRQTVVTRALDWPAPAFAHIPLIHGGDGAKMSKRHGALGVEAYREMGYLPEALSNYLLRLGWAHGDEEIITREQAIDWFSLDAVGRSPSRFDLAKLDHVNGHYIRQADDERLAALVMARLTNSQNDGGDAVAERLARGMSGLKSRAKTIVELADGAGFYAAEPPLSFTEKAANLLDGDARGQLAALRQALGDLGDWQEAALEAAVRSFAETRDLKLGSIAQPLRAALTGSTKSPGIFEVLEVLGRTESLRRIGAVCGV